MENSIKPLRDIVLVRADKPPTQTTSGLYIQEKWKTLPPKGTVEAIGPTVENKQLVVGARVYFERYGSVILDEDLRLCKESHIMAILDEKR